jgi:hypothetical protein
MGGIPKLEFQASPPAFSLSSSFASISSEQRSRLFVQASNLKCGDPIYINFEDLIVVLIY